MQARRLVPLGLALALLLAAAGLASHGRPLSGSRGSGPTATFFDYALTTLLLAIVALAAVLVVSLLGSKPAAPAPQPRRWRLLSTLLVVAGALALSFLIYRGNLKFRDLHGQQAAPPHAAQPAILRRHIPAAHRRSARVRWDEVAIVAGLLAVGAGAMYAAGRRRTPRPPWRLRSLQAVSAALDLSLDDLRNEPDLRKAIIAAYARMEQALALAGVARRPAEAPFEYLVRALQALDASAAASRRLTDLFEWAKFSQHAPDAAMRDEAVDALVAVRDELRRPAAVAA